MVGPRENLADLEGVVTGRSEPRIDGHLAIELAVDRVDSVEDKHNMLGSSLGRRVVVHLHPDRMDTPNAGERTRLRSKMAGPGRIVAREAHPARLTPAALIGGDDGMVTAQLTTSEPERSHAFYVDMLGLESIDGVDDSRYRLGPGFQLAIATMAEGSDVVPMTLRAQHSDLAGLADRLDEHDLEAKLVTVQAESDEEAARYVLIMSDPDGNLLVLESVDS